jgi:hypothetical protein
VRRAALTALLAALALPASAHAAADHLTVGRGQLRDSRGRQVVLHGVNVVYKLAPYLPEFTRAQGVRVVRCAPLTLRGAGRASITVTRGHG